MGWLPIFKRKPTGDERNASPGRGSREKNPRSAAATADSVQQARTRARRRLIGAAVLVIAGVIGFPILFESQPRPVPVDIPIEIPRKEGAPPLAMPAARQQPPVAAASAAPAPQGMITETEADAGREVTKPAPAAPVVSKPALAAAKPNVPASHVATPKPATPPPTNTAKADADRAAALLAGRPVAKVEPAAPKAATPASTAASGPGRFIVQAGAFIDAAAARDTRVKLERLGLKTYTQVADTPAGPRVRVRLGPFASRADADKALAKAKAAGLAAVVVTL